MDTRKALELCAPARDLATGKAAIDCGADAVYIGAPKFSARKACSNSMADIERLIHYAHPYHVKVYLALNTLLYDHELKEALDIITKAYQAGIDAIIIQDMGLLECGLPPVALHASTQTDNRIAEKVQFLEKAGFSRVILARELDLEAISAIRSASDIELECFIHGALCVSYSGQCYMSSAMSRRSANRGDCIQACRLPYDVLDGDGTTLLSGKHVLSLKDLNLQEHLMSLIGAGISSFKIEGRLKDAGYVKNITAYYRKALDTIIANSRQYKKASSGQPVFTFTPDPYITFNRGYTDYFIHGRRSGLACFETPKSTGKRLGKVAAVNNDHCTLDSSAEVHNGDGICFFNRSGQLQGVRINKVIEGKLFPDRMEGLSSGMTIYRNADKAFDDCIRRAVLRRVAVCIEVTDNEDLLIFKARDEDGVTASCDILLKLELADNPEKAREILQRQLKKSGGSIFSVIDVRITTNRTWFLPIGIINEKRRQLLDLLYNRRMEAHGCAARAPSASNFSYMHTKLDFRGNVVNAKARTFYKRHGVRTIDDGFDKAPGIGAAAVMTTKYCLRYEMGMCPHKGVHKETRACPSPWSLKTGNHHFALRFDCKKCEMKITVLR